MRQQSIVSPGEYQQAIKGLTDQVNQYRAEINAVNQRLNSVTNYRGRMYNSLPTSQYQELAAIDISFRKS